MVFTRISSNGLSIAVLALLAACSGGSHSAGVPAPALPPLSNAANSGDASSLSTTVGTTSVLSTLDDEHTVGSAADPVTMEVNPYGLDVARVTSGKIDAGDLVVCDFNDKQNVQGTGSSILALHPALGSTPRHITTLPSLLGCDALAMAPNGTIWNAAFAANDNPIVNGNGAQVNTLASGPWHHPFGEAFAPPVNSISVPAFYVSNAGDGSLVRVYVNRSGPFTFSTIVHNFPVNGGAPGSILGPSGLTYQPVGDRLYVVDGTNNALYAINHISEIETNGITVSSGGNSFTGKFASDAHLIFKGAPLNGPISAALLPGGNIVLGNTLDPNGKNLMVEISPSGHVLDVKNVDTGAAGAIFGMVATGSTAASVKLYFNDDNDNTVKVLTP